MSYDCISRMFIFVTIDTLAWMLKALVTCLYKCQYICVMIVWISEYFLMGKYSLVGWCLIILYYIIEGWYVQTVNLSVYILKTIKDLRSHKACTNITANKPWKKNRRVRQYWRGWSELNNPDPLKEISQRTQMIKTKYIHPIQRVT